MSIKHTFTFSQATTDALEDIPKGFRSKILSKAIEQMAALHRLHGTKALGPLTAGEFEITLNGVEGR